MATASFLFFLVSLPGGVVFDVTSDVYYWFFAGLLMLAVRLDQRGRGGRAPANGPGPPPARPARGPAPSRRFPRERQGPQGAA